MYLTLHSSNTFAPAILVRRTSVSFGHMVGEAVEPHERPTGRYLSRQSNGRSNPEVVGSIPTEVKRFFLYLVWLPDSLY